MHKLLFFLGVSVLALSGMAQVKDPVKWTATSLKNGDKYEITLTATLPKPWHIYSQKTGDGGPIPTKVTFAKNPLLNFEGNVKEIGKLKEEYDKNFDTKVKFYGDRVAFVQKVKVKGNVKTNVGVTIEYMVCDDEKCLPPTKKTFNVALK